MSIGAYGKEKSTVREESKQEFSPIKKEHMLRDNYSSNILFKF